MIEYGIVDILDGFFKVNKYANIMKIQEIDYADSIPNLNITQTQIDQATNMGTVDQVSVYGINDGKNLIVFMKNNSEISAYIAFTLDEYQGFNNLLRMHNVSSKKGSITALIAFIHKKYSTKFRIDKSEKLTNEGLDWICKLLDEGRGFTITDLTGSNISSQNLRDSWLQARRTGSPTNIGILIQTINVQNIVLETRCGILQPSLVYLNTQHISKPEKYIV